MSFDILFENIDWLFVNQSDPHPTLGLNIFIAYILHAGDWATSYINIIYALSPGKYKQCHDNKQMNMSYEYIQWIDMTDYNHTW